MKTKRMAWTNELKYTKEFLRYLCALDLSGDPRKICDDMYDELETCDVDVEEEAIQRCGSLPSKMKTKILSLIEFYYQNADNCVNIDSDEERRAILRALKIRAKEAEPYIGQLGQ